MPRSHVSLDPDPSVERLSRQMSDVLLLLMAGCDDGGGGGEGALLRESPRSRKQPLGNVTGRAENQPAAPAVAAGDGVDFTARWQLRLSARPWFGQRAGKCGRRQYRLFSVCGLMIESDTDGMNVFRISAQTQQRNIFV